MKARKEGGWDSERSGDVRGGCDTNPLQLRLLQSLRLGATILEPDLDLNFCEFEIGGEFGPLGDGEVLLLAVFLLQRVELLGREGGAGLAIWFVLSKVASEGAEVRPMVLHISVKHVRSKSKRCSRPSRSQKSRNVRQVWHSRP